MSYVNVNGEPMDMTALWKRQGVVRLDLKAKGIGKRNPTVLNGYAAPPGTGPLGETCKTCAHKRSMTNRSGAKHFIKCEANRERWTHGEGSDIRAGSPACRVWMAQIEGAA